MLRTAEPHYFSCSGEEGGRRGKLGGGGTKILALQSLRVCSLYLCSNILVKVIIYNETIHFLQKVDLIAKEAAPDGVGYFFVC